MSRTFRRKHHPLETWHLSDYEWVPSREGGTHLARVRLVPGSRPYVRAYWDLHADCHPGRWGVPRWYRRNLNRHARHSEAAVLHHTLAAGELEVVLPRRRRNAGWYWF